MYSSAIVCQKDTHVVAEHVPCDFTDKVVDVKSELSGLEWSQFEGYLAKQVWMGMENEMSCLHEFQVFAW
eukprot:14360268-Heterocapsa_arctica.AAC.1